MKAMLWFGVALVRDRRRCWRSVLAIPFSSPATDERSRRARWSRSSCSCSPSRSPGSCRSRTILSGWIIGVALRFVTLIAYAFVAVKVLGMPAPAALISLVTFLFISTLVEPKLLTL